MMSRDSSETKNKIMEATIALLIECPPENITIRQIAELAGVNTAAINYHFGSKEQLLMKAVDYSVETGSQDIIDMLSNHELPPRERIYNYFISYTTILADYPNPSRIAVSVIYQDRPSEEIHVTEIQTKVFHALAQAIGELGNTDDKKKIEYVITILYATVHTCFLSQKYIKKVGTIDFNNVEEREALINFLMDMLINSLK